MPPWAGQPQFPRSSVRLPLRYAAVSPTIGRIGMGWTRNVSEGGACLEVPELFPHDAALRLWFQTDRGAVEAEAVVVWAAAATHGQGPMLHGVAFTRMAPQQRQTLRALLQTPTAVRHSGVRYAADFPVAYRVPNQAGLPRWGRIENVSRGGMLLSLDERLQPGTRLTVIWQIAGEDLSGEGTIVWVEPGEGGTSIRHGFRFTTLDAADTTITDLGLMPVLWAMCPSSWAITKRRASSDS